jgi:tetratricopeptide (TPR) repeat protein
VFFHLANTLLLFILLSRMTAALWPSAVVAALFALHPLHVESVAWVSERKDVLSTFFGLLTLMSYMRYTQRRSRTGYILALMLFGMGLMAKPMLVTLPFVMLLLDYWPLARIKFDGAFRLQPSDEFRSVLSLLFEKVPFFMLSTASCVVTYYAQKSSGSLMSYDLFPLGSRIANAIVSYVAYMGKMFWPANLAIFYPYPDSFAAWRVAGAAAVLIIIFIGVTLQIRVRPYLAVGWFWYFGTLVPVIGLVQVGGQAMADRYTYVPLIGLFIMMVWGGAEMFGRWRRIGGVVAISTAAIVMSMLIAARMQTHHWLDSIHVFEHAIDATGGSWIAHFNLAKAITGQGRKNEALAHYHLALQKKPPEPEVIYYNIASVLASQGLNLRAIESYSEAIKKNPDYANAHINLGVILARQGRTADAMHHYSEALRIEPSSDKAHFNLGNALLAEGRIDAANISFSRALRINPLFAEAYNSMGTALMQKGELEEAILNYRKAANIKPDYVDAQRNLKLAVSIHAKISKAIAGMRDSMNFNPQDSEISLKMLKLLNEKIDLDQTVSRLNKALSLQPGFAAVEHNKISMVIDIEKEYEGKMPLFHKIIEYWPENAEAYYHIACIYSRKGRVKDSVKCLNQAIQKGFNRWDLLNADSDLDPIRNSNELQILSKGG